MFKRGDKIVFKDTFAQFNVGMDINKIYIIERVNSNYVVIQGIRNRVFFKFHVMTLDNYFEREMIKLKESIKV